MTQGGLSGHHYLEDDDLCMVNGRAAVVTDAIRHNYTCSDGCCWYPDGMTLEVKFVDTGEEYEVTDSDELDYE